jgi:hypothetical protein
MQYVSIYFSEQKISKAWVLFLFPRGKYNNIENSFSLDYAFATATRGLFNGRRFGSAPLTKNPSKDQWGLRVEGDFAVPSPFFSAPSAPV